MPRTPRDVTDTELAVLEVLWNQDQASRRQITEALYPGGGPAQYATVQKLLERLETKGYVHHLAGQGVQNFRAIVSREELIGQRLRDMAEKLCGGSLTPLLMNLVRAKPLNPRELEELQTLLQELQSQAKTKGKQR